MGDEDKFFGKRSVNAKVWTMESDDPMETAMDFYSRISEGNTRL